MRRIIHAAGSVSWLPASSLLRILRRTTRPHWSARIRIRLQLRDSSRFSRDSVFPVAKTLCFHGARDGARSRNPQIHNLMLYQLSYSRHRKNGVYYTESPSVFQSRFSVFYKTAQSALAQRQFLTRTVSSPLTGNGRLDTASCRDAAHRPCDSQVPSYLAIRRCSRCVSCRICPQECSACRSAS